MKLLTTALALLVAGTVAFAQNVTVSGKVVDENNAPLMGAGIIQQGTSNGTTSDLDGLFRLQVPKGSVVVVLSLGYAPQEFKADSDLNLSVKLSPDTELLEETVVVGYGVQKKESLTAAITQIRPTDIASTKSADGVLSLQGKVPGLLITQNNGKPGAFNSQISLRGYGAPILVVDGVVRSTYRTRKVTGYNTDPTALESYNDLSVLNELNPEDIESISVLKDASATIYGLGAQNGVILITTRSGKARKPSVNFSANLSLAQPVIPRDVVDWVTFMKAENAMSDVSKMNHRFSEDIIAAYEMGDPNFVYTDWFEATHKKFAFNQQYNVSLTGGTDRFNYYFSGNFADDNSILKADNYGYNRYNFTANVSVKLLDNLTMRYTSTFRQSTNLGLGSGDMDHNIFYYVYQSNPMVDVHTKDNPNHYSDVEEHTNPVALMDAETSGYTKSDNKSFNNTIDLTYEAPFLRGLRFQVSGAADFGRLKQRTLIKQYRLYDYMTDVSSPTQHSREEPQYSELWTDNTRWYGRAQATYDHNFGKHGVQVMVGAELIDQLNASVNAARYYGPTSDQFLYTHDVINQGLASRSSNSGTRYEERSAGYIGRINYNYSGKYLLEVMGRYDGNYRFQKGHRWGFFPSYSLGWRLSEEKFFHDLFPFVNNLKFRWSDGYTGSPQGSAYAYINGYTASSQWVFSDGAVTTGYNNSSVANTVLTWADVRMEDFGVDWEFWQGKFGGTFDWFKRELIGTAAQRSVSLPDFYAVSIPSENLNRSETQGLELTLYHNNHIGEFFYRVQATATIARSRATYVESEKTRVYKSSMDYWKNGYIGRWGGYFDGSYYNWAGGQFTSLEDASASEVLYSTSGDSDGNRVIIPGMYKLEDRNGNGYIDGDDVYYTWGTGSGNPPLQFGLNITGNWKGFDFSLIFNGAAMKNRSFMMSGWAGFGKLNYLPTQFLDSYHVAIPGADPWDPETEWVAGYWPALARVAQVGTANNGTYTYNQPYNYVNASYLRLKSVEVGYKMSPAFLRKAGIKSARIYLNGGNLLTICNKLLKYVDPELDDVGTAGGMYPISKTYSMGLNLNF